MLSAQFLLKVLSVPWVVLRIVIQYYTTGTWLMSDRAEFGRSLWKNVCVSVMAHVAKGMQRTDPLILEHPMKFYNKYKSSPGASGMPGFGARWSRGRKLTWVVRPEERKALLFLHGGGYCVPMTGTQFVGIMALWYPTQIHEAVEAYRVLSGLGYEEVMVIGDSCGSNLALALARYVSYPRKRGPFSGYTQFQWNFDLSRPSSIFFLWLRGSIPTERSKSTSASTTRATWGLTSDMGDYYIEGSSKDDVWPWVDFHRTNYTAHWAKVPAFNGEGSTLVLYGEREVFRKGQEDFFRRNGLHKFSVHMQPGPFTTRCLRGAH
ncbi:hypothetical protein CJJ09_000062 [Candidozyma auris]|nr:hypothetical protein CJJ09_000062 [[Candida] auris]